MARAVTPTVVDLLDRLRARGVELVAAGDRLRFRPADALTADELEALRRHKAEVLALLTAPAGVSASAPGAPAVLHDAHESEYRETLARAFALIARGADADALDCRRVLDDEARLIDEVGVRRADLIRAEVARTWHAEHGTCPWCGDRGPLHDPGNRHG